MYSEVTSGSKRLVFYILKVAAHCVFFHAFGTKQQKQRPYHILDIYRVSVWCEHIDVLGAD